MSDLQVLVIGSGGREHALAWKLAQSEKVGHVYVAPGNAGTAQENKVTNVTDLNIKDHKAVADWCKQEKISFVVVGPEDPLAQGIKDSLSSQGVACFGPTQQAAQLEASKAFAKEFMTRNNIPTARWQSFTDPFAAKEHIKNAPYKALVIKASGLAAGKGVVVAENVEEACRAVDSIMVEGSVGSAGKDLIVIEELLEGQEVSVLAFTDGTHFSIMPPLQDHKRLLDGDKGPNTGGMGAYSPVPLVTKKLMKTIKEEIISRTLSSMKKENTPFEGVLYAGLMVTPLGQPKVLEFNCRFGDPECQVALSLLETDLADIIEACLKGSLDSLHVEFKPSTACVGVVVASEGYPLSYAKGIPITRLPTDCKVFHAGTAFKDDVLVTSGGRVLTVVASDKSLREAALLATFGASKVEFKGAFYRKDIAHRAFVRLQEDGLTYRACGVDIEAADDLVDFIKEETARTLRPGAACDSVGGFGALFDLNLERKYSRPLLVTGTDGVGTKLLVANAMGKHDTVGIDLVAMVVNDLLCQGAEPLIFLDYYASSHLDPSVFKEVIRGIVEGCVQAGCTLQGGETAEVPPLYRPNEYELAGFGVGVVEHSQRLPRLSEIKPGDVVVGLSSSGLHSNGFSMVRKLVEQVLGLDYSAPAPFLPGDQRLGDVLLIPTKIYVKQVLPLIHHNWIKALAHITGGGLVNNLPRVLPQHLCVTLDASKWVIPPVFSWIAKQGKVKDEEMLRTFNLGIGLVAIVDPAHISSLKEETPEALVIGTVQTRETPDQSQVQVSNLIFDYTGPLATITRKKVAVLISGSGTNLQSLLDATANKFSAAEIVLVVSNKPGVLGLERARQAGVKTVVISHQKFPTREDFDMAVHEKLQEAGVEIVCLAGFMRILSARFVSLWRGRLINIHPSLLPSFKGAHAHRDVLAQGVPITGCSVHFVEPEVDAGKIIIQAAVPVKAGDTVSTLQERVKEQEHKIYPRALELVARGQVKHDTPSTHLYSSFYGTY